MEFAYDEVCLRGLAAIQQQIGVYPKDGMVVRMPLAQMLSQLNSIVLLPLRSKEPELISSGKQLLPWHPGWSLRPAGNKLMASG